MATIMLCEKHKFSYIHPQTSRDGLNLPTMHPPPPNVLHGKKLLTEKIVMNLMLTPFFTEVVNTNLWVRQCDR